MTIENILAVYDMATPEEIREGVVWYATALAECKRISIDNGVPLNTVVGVTAALSPNNKWTKFQGFHLYKNERKGVVNT